MSGGPRDLGESKVSGGGPSVRMVRPCPAVALNCSQSQLDKTTENIAATSIETSTETVALFNTDVDPTSQETSSTVTAHDAHQQRSTNTIVVKKYDVYAHMLCFVVVFCMKGKKPFV